jgi:hypothetical protein
MRSATASSVGDVAPSPIASKILDGTEAVGHRRGEARRWDSVDTALRGPGGVGDENLRWATANVADWPRNYCEADKRASSANTIDSVPSGIHRELRQRLSHGIVLTRMQLASQTVLGLECDVRRRRLQQRAVDGELDRSQRSGPSRRELYVERPARRIVSAL